MNESEPQRTPTPDAIVEELRAALAAAPEAALAPWALTAVHVRMFRAPAAVIEWKAPDATLGFIIAPTNPEERTFTRTRRFDVVYFSEDFEDDDQHACYQRDQSFINHFARWMKKWDPS